MSEVNQNMETEEAAEAADPWARAEKRADSWMEPATETAGTKKGKASIRRKLLSHGWILKNMPFFLFLAALAVIYIYNGHYADKIVRDINRTNKELKELQYEYKTLKSEVMFRSKQSELAKAVGPFGLKELTAPPYVIPDSSR